MHLKFKYDQVKGRKNPEPETDKPEDGVEILQYKGISSNRRVCFIQPDGSRKALPYAHLTEHNYDPEKGEIALHFYTYLVTIKGSNLDELFEEIMHEVARVIIATDKRYEGASDSEVSITEIVIEESKDSN